MWRPKDWVSPYLPHSTMGHGCRAPEGCEGCSHDTFEAGADAMLESLLSQVHQDWLATADGEGCKGKWVFIPEENDG